jgi:hypothetical protein
VLILKEGQGKKYWERMNLLVLQIN